MQTPRGQWNRLQLLEHQASIPGLPLHRPTDRHPVSDLPLLGALVVVLSKKRMEPLGLVVVGCLVVVVIVVDGEATNGFISY